MPTRELSHILVIFYVAVWFIILPCNMSQYSSMSIKVKRQRLRLGLIYGMVAGLAFALLTWGLDAWLLVRANATYPWVKFIPGVIICINSGGLAGWLTMLFEKHGMALFFLG